MDFDTRAVAHMGGALQDIMAKQLEPNEDRLMLIIRRYEYHGRGTAVLLKDFTITFLIIVKPSCNPRWTLALVVEDCLLDTDFQGEDVYLGELSSVETKLALAPELEPPVIESYGIFDRYSPSLHGFPEVIHSIGDEVTCPLHMNDRLLTLHKPEARCLAFALVLPRKGPGACLPPPIPGTFRHLVRLPHIYRSFAAACQEILGYPRAGNSASPLKGTGDFNFHQCLAYADSPVVRHGAMAVALIGPSKDGRSLPPMMQGSSPTSILGVSRDSALWEPMKSISFAWRGKSALRYERNCESKREARARTWEVPSPVGFTQSNLEMPHLWRQHW